MTLRAGGELRVLMAEHALDDRQQQAGLHQARVVVWRRSRKRMGRTCATGQSSTPCVGQHLGSVSGLRWRCRQLCFLQLEATSSPS